MRNILRKASGFTLIELLVGVAIVAILGGLALIDLSHSRKISRDAVRKEDVNSLVAAVKLYGLTNSSYFIQEKGQTCNVPVDSTEVATDPGCVGANGRSFGKVNFTGTINGYTYSKSIVSVLAKDGYLGAKAQDPLGAKNVSDDWDYTLLRCKRDWHQSYDKTDTYFAVWAILETPQQDIDRDNTNRSCGGQVTARYIGIADYDFASAAEIVPALTSTKRAVITQNCLQYTDAVLPGSNATSGNDAPNPSCSGGGGTATSGASPSSTNSTGSPSLCPAQTTAAENITRYQAVLPPQTSAPAPSSNPNPTNTSSAPAPDCGGPDPSTSPSTSPSSSSSASATSSSSSSPSGSFPFPTLISATATTYFYGFDDTGLVADPEITPPADYVEGKGERYSQGIGTL